MKQRRADAIPAAIQWHDGLLLEPQHFQESARRGERLLDYHLAQLAPYHYGVVDATTDLSPSTGRLRVTRLEAILPSGLVVRHPFGAAPGRVASSDPEIDLASDAYRSLFGGADPVTVYLTVAAEDAPPDAVRYDTDATAFARDEIGGQQLEVPRLLPRLSLSVAREPGRDCLPIARVKKESRGFVLADYEPPCLALRGTSRAYRLCADDVVLRFREKAERLAASAHDLSESTLTEWQRKLKLERQVVALVAALPPLQALLDSERAHPYAVYLALAAVVGQSAAALPKPIPKAPSQFRYDHEDLLGTFQQVRDILRDVCDGIVESFEAYALRYDRGQHRYQVELPAVWKTKHLALGVRPLSGRESVSLSGWMSEARIAVRSRLGSLPVGRGTGVPRAQRDDARVPGAAKDLLREIVLPDGGEVYWLDRGSDDLVGQGPLVISNAGNPVAEADNFQLTLYVSHNEAVGTGGEGRGA